MNRPLTETDIAELERMLIEEGGSSPEDLGRGREQCQKSGSFRAIAPRVEPWRPQGSFFGIPGGLASLPNEIAFHDMLINHLTEHGDCRG